VKAEYEQDEVRRFREMFLRRQMAWSYSLSQRLRGEAATAHLERFISRRELSSIGRYSNPPAALLELHGTDLSYALEQGWINQFQQVELDRTLTRLCDSMGKCERIKNTVFPATYSLYIHLAMNVFILMLPFALIEFFSVMEVPIVVVIAGLFMLIEKMAIHLQDPFENKPTDTPMTAISNAIEQDLRQMLNDHSTPVAASAHIQKGYYQL
jgi:putative membrane protein